MSINVPETAEEYWAFAEKGDPDDLSIGNLGFGESLSYRVLSGKLCVGVDSVLFFYLVKCAYERTRPEVFALIIECHGRNGIKGLGTYISSD